ncbi:MAG: TetR family transcriptional regulator [Actinomycetes bacterium]
MTTEVSARRAATRDRLVDAAMTVFAERGVVGATVEEICEAAGFTRGAFYSNFESKDELCVAVLEHQYEANLAAMRDALAAVDSLGDAGLDELIPRAIAVFLSSQQSGRIWVLSGQELRLYAARTPALAVAYRRLYTTATRTMAAVLEEAVEALGCELLPGGAEAIGVLHAVHDYGAVGSLIGSDTIEGDVKVRLLTEVLRALVRPRR